MKLSSAIITFCLRTGRQFPCTAVELDDCRYAMRLEREQDEETDDDAYNSKGISYDSYAR